jgi:hypothetical protein
VRLRRRDQQTQASCDADAAVPGLGLDRDRPRSGGKLYRMPMDGQLAELDPVTLAPIHTYTVPKHEDGDPALVADDSGHLYYRPDYMKLYRIDIASGAVDMFLQLPWEETPTGLAWGFGSLWITNFDADSVWRVNTSV